MDEQYLLTIRTKERNNTKCKSEVLVRTAKIKNIFSKGDTTIWSFLYYTITKLIHDTIPSYRIHYVPEGYNNNVLRPPKIRLESKRSNYENTIFAEQGIQKEWE